VLLWVFAMAQGPEHPTRRVDSVAKTLPAAHVLRPGDQIVAVDGHAGGPGRVHDLLAKHRCPVQPPRSGCRAATPATVVVRRGARRLVLRLTPVYDRATKSMRIGFTYGFANDPEPPGAAVKTAANQFWFFSRKTVALPLRVFNAKKRKEIGSAVGAYEVTRQTIETNATQAIGIIALISLSLAIINLYPFLPLDGGHIFWAIVEKVRRRPVPFSVMERASVIGFGLVLIFFFIGLSNDIGRLTGQGFQTR
jgi:regulator of sigma E protease